MMVYVERQRRVLDIFRGLKKDPIFFQKMNDEVESLKIDFPKTSFKVQLTAPFLPHPLGMSDELCQQNITMQKRSSQRPHPAAKRNQLHHLQIQDASEFHSKIEKEDAQPLPSAIQAELQLNLEKYSLEIKEEIRYILLDLLKYPSSAAAERHRASNRLGGFDLKQVRNKQADSMHYFRSYHPPQFCQDCGLAVQEREIPICASVWEFPRVGEAVFHLFQNIKLLAAMVFMLGVLFSILALYASILEPTESFSIANLPRKVSYSALMLYSAKNSFLTIFLGIEGLLLVLTTISWILLQLVSHCLRQKYQGIIQQQNISAADFTIMLEDVPAYYTKERLQNEFNRYFESLVYHHNLKKTWGEQLKPFEIDRVCMALPFGLSQGEVLDQQLEGLDEDIVQKRRLLAEWMLEFKENSRFTFQRGDRKREYDQFQRMLQRRRDKVQEMEDRAREQYKLPLGKDLKTIFFVTFKHSQSASIIQSLNPQSIPAKIRYLLTCCRSAQYFSVVDEQTSQQMSINASRAPDPQDIIWGNLKTPLKKRILSKLLIWAVIVGIWGATFGVCYGFNYLGIMIGGSTYMSIVMAAIVTIANMLIKFVVRIMNQYERDETETDRQRGILIKCLISLPVNWILTPVLITLVVNLSIYDSTGLVYFVFFLSLTNSILPPLFLLFDPYHFFRKLKALWKDRPYKRMELRQSELNACLQNEEYEVGWCYVYFIEQFYFTCIYAPMLPSVTITTLFGYFCMFWIESYVLLHRSRRPPPHMKALSETAQTAMLLGPLLMGIGGFIWVCVFSLDFSSIAFIAYMIQIGIGLLYFIIPFRSIFKCLCAVHDEQIMIYEECRSKIPAQYERLNPVTMEKAAADYYLFLQRKKEDDRVTLHNLSEGNLATDPFDINLMVQGLTKIPTIFGKNTEITRKIEGQTFTRNRVKKPTEEVIIVTPPPNVLDHAKKEEDELQMELTLDLKNLPEKFQPSLSRADTEKKPIANYNSSGNAYYRRKAHSNQRTISVLNDNSYDVVIETQSQKH